MMVYLIDNRAPNAPAPASLDALALHHDRFEDGWRRVLRALPGHENAEILFVGPDENLIDIMARVIAVVHTAWSIYLLRIIAHGSPGYLELGAGVARSQAREFRQLARSLTPAHLNGRGVEIHGCNVASGASGRALLQRIADAVGMPVSGTTDVQLADNRFQFEGNLTRFEPHSH